MPDEFEAAAVRAALDDILRWPVLMRSPQVGNFLRHIVEARLEGRESQIKAYSIAVDVFGRAADFDPQTDPIVRVQARRLRALLRQYYEELGATADVEITLPTGRYVPEFIFHRPPPRIDGAAPSVLSLAGPAPEDEPEPGFTPARIVARRAKAANRSIVPRLGGTGLLLAIGVVGFVGLQGWLGSKLQPQAIGGPRPPLLRVTGFSDQTGLSGGGDLAHRLSSGIEGALSVKEGVRLESPAGHSATLLLSGTVHLVSSALQVDAVLADATTGVVQWNTTYAGRPGTRPATEVAPAALAVATRLSVPWGPLHAAGRRWLSSRTPNAVEPSDYVCQLEYEVARERGRSAEVARALDCLEALLKAKPRDAYALSAWSGLQSWVVVNQASPSTDLRAALASVVPRAEQASSIRPDSSFAIEQLGVVRARFDPQSGAEDLRQALEIDPGNLAARIELGWVLARLGDWPGATRESGQAIGAAVDPPAWYFRVEALDAIRRGDAVNAVAAAHSYLPADPEMGPVLALCAAQMAGETDRYAQYVSMIASNENFRAFGIGPRLSVRIPDVQLRDKIGRVLTAAGISEAQWRAPF